MRSIELNADPVDAIREAWAALYPGECLVIRASYRKHSDAQIAWYPWHAKWHPMDGKETRCLFVDIVSAIGTSDPISSIRMEGSFIEAITQKP